MQNSKLMVYLLSAWIMALIYDYIERVSGIEIGVLLCGAVVTMVTGLYFGLYAKNNESKEEEI